MAKRLAHDLPKDVWHAIRWREGSAEWLSSRFARVRVRVGHTQLKPELLLEKWLLIEWPAGEAEPTKYWLSTLPADISFRDLVDLAKLRWRIERDYLELKQEVGLGHFEGRGWRGFHHHATMCIAAYGFLISERETISPLNTSARHAIPDVCSTRRLSTQRIPPCGLNATFRTRSRPCVCGWSTC
jgi:SRSO17 transposase